MQNKSSLVIFIIVAIVLVLGITFWANGTTPKEEGTPADTNTPSTSTPGGATSVGATSYTLAQVATHKTPADCWTTISGKVYNLTPFVSKHPGGVDKIIRICGLDGTSVFTNQHGGQDDPMKALVGLEIGVLAR